MEGRHSRFIAKEDVRKIPITVLARNVQRAELGMQNLSMFNEDEGIRPRPKDVP